MDSQCPINDLSTRNLIPQAGAIIENRISFNVLPAISALPCAFGIGRTVITSTGYRHNGYSRSKPIHNIFQFTASGFGFFKFRGQEYELPAGTAFLCNSHDPDVSYYYGNSYHGTWETYYCSFWGGNAVIAEIIENYGPVVHLSHSHSWLNQFRSIKGKRIKKTSTELASALIAQILGTVIDSHRETAVNKEYSYLINQVILILNNNANAKTQVRDLAVQLKISPEHLSRKFKKETGIPLKLYIDQKIVEQAIQMMQIHPYSIKEITHFLSFSKSSHFIRMFKRIKGSTPAEFRKNIYK